MSEDELARLAQLREKKKSHSDYVSQERAKKVQEGGVEAVQEVERAKNRKSQDKINADPAKRDKKKQQAKKSYAKQVEDGGPKKKAGIVRCIEKKDAIYNEPFRRVLRDSLATLLPKWHMETITTTEVNKLWLPLLQREYQAGRVEQLCHGRTLPFEFVKGTDNTTLKYLKYEFTHLMEEQLVKSSARTWKSKPGGDVVLGSGSGSGGGSTTLSVIQQIIEE